jgi:KipI family sensor histidine kinase inhibitor
VLRYGERALIVECSDADETAALHAELVRRKGSGVLTPCEDLIPAELTVVVDGLDDPLALARELSTWRLCPVEGRPGDVGSATRSARVVELPVRYDGPDLDEVAAAWGVSREEAVRVHAGVTYRVAFCGFAPGFAYMTGLPERYHLPRRSTPRTGVPPGSVAVAGQYTGAYPRSSPGGWHLIGTTDAVLWDTARAEPALLAPGTLVRVVVTGAGSRGSVGRVVDGGGGR